MVALARLLASICDSTWYWFSAGARSGVVALVGVGDLRGTNEKAMFEEEIHNRRSPTYDGEEKFGEEKQQQTVHVGMRKIKSASVSSKTKRVACQ